jgi:peptidoglycan/LPS O-acetylase OafA/YrhL
LKRLSFIPQLDSFRFFSVVFVMLSHWLPGFKYFAAGASLGVTFFFVLSGYLISSNLLYQKQAIDAGEISRPFAFLQFYYRRTLRIFPLYYLVILLLFISVPAIFEGKVLWFVSYLPNIMMFRYHFWPGMLSHLWSLGVEEQFYLLWPLLIFFTPWRWLRGLFIITILSSIVFKVILFCFFPNPYMNMLPLSAFDVFGMGALLAYLPFSAVPAWTSKVSLSAFFIVCAALSVLALSIASFNLLFNVFYSGCAVVIIFKSQKGFTGIFGKFLDFRAFQYLGKISYGLYIYHSFMPWLLRCLTGTETRYYLPIAILPKSLAGKAVITLSAQFILLVIVASLSWFLFEKPINNLKDLLKAKNQSYVRAQRT